MGIKRLAKDSVIYGLSSIVGRFLNWLLVPLYTYTISKSDFGVYTNVYAWTALLLVILTYGMETGFFRFATDPKNGNRDTTLSTILTSLSITSTVFLILTILFASPLSQILQWEGHSEYVIMVAVILVLDTLTAVPFANLRLQNKAMRFMWLKMISIIISIGLNLIFFLVLPSLINKYNIIPIDSYHSFSVGLILLANLVSSAVTLLLLLPDVTKIKWHYDGALLKKILRYSLPILVLGIAGIMNQTIDKIIYPILGHGGSIEATKAELGIYGANYKIGVIMMMFTQAFRYAFEPFIFSKSQDNDKLRSYALAMKYFIIFGLLIFLGVMFYLDIVKYFISPKYFEGLVVVPIVLIADLFSGIVFNLSLWYKLTDRTMWGAWFSIGGLVIILAVNIIFVPIYGYIACAWACLVCYGAMMIASYFVGQHYYPIKYDLKSVVVYSLLTIILFLIDQNVHIDDVVLKYSFKTVLILIFITFTIIRDLPFIKREFINHILKR